jgi:DNA-binding transcriptional ArsR family regulator
LIYGKAIIPVKLLYIVKGECRNMENTINSKVENSSENFTLKLFPYRLFYCLSSPIRLRIIISLSGEKMTVNHLSKLLEVSQPSISGQLAILQKYGIVQSWQTGREKYYKIIPESIESLTSWLDDIAISINMINVPQPRLTHYFAEGRRCYDHLAGKNGVKLLKLMMSRKWIAIKSDKPEYKLTDLGEIKLTQLGVHIPVPKKHGRIFAYGCRDLTEKEHHLGGALGSEIMKALVKQGYIIVHKDTRIVNISIPIDQWLDTH